MTYEGGMLSLIVGFEYRVPTLLSLSLSLVPDVILLTLQSTTLLNSYKFIVQVISVTKYKYYLKSLYIEIEFEKEGMLQPFGTLGI
jgi:hypothetical protein